MSATISTLYTPAAQGLFLWTTPTTGLWSRWWLCREVRSMLGLTKDPSWPLVNNIPGESSVITKLRMHCADKYERGIFNWSWTWSRPCYFLPPPPVHDNSLICWIRHDKVDEITRRICDLGNESEEFHASRNVMGLFIIMKNLFVFFYYIWTTYLEQTKNSSNLFDTILEQSVETFLLAAELMLTRSHSNKYFSVNTFKYFLSDSHLRISNYE